MGEYCLVGRGRFNGKETERSVFHALELNQIQLSALRAGLLVRWISSMEIRSQNELTQFGYAKDYDAVVTVRTRNGERRFALEYERSPKPKRYYSGVAAALDHEAHVSHVLYLACNYDLLQFVSGFFRRSHCQVFFGLVNDWHEQLLDLPAVFNATNRSMHFSEGLTHKLYARRGREPVRLRRNRLVAGIKAIQKALGVGETRYRQVLFDLTGKHSTTEMQAEALERVFAHFRQLQGEAETTQ